MNRLIIVGNGFDIANGLKTKYSDFLLDYFLERIKELKNAKENSDGLLTIKRALNKYPIINSNFSKISSLKKLKENEYLEVRCNGTIHSTPNNPSQVIFDFDSKFFYSIYDQLDWSGIEDLYFKHLLEIKSTNKPENEIREALIELNDHFGKIKELLRSYLKTITKENYIRAIKKSPFLNSIQTSLRKEFGLHEIDPSRRLDIKNEYAKEKKDWIIKKNMIVNFNYTNLAEELLGTSLNAEVVNIHNTLNDEDLIFGYGDETHIDYKSIEQVGIKEYLDNMKSIHYNLGANLIKLMELIYKDYYDVYVLGHSLGLSDRVLLKEIFENEYCLSIKLFHRGSKESYLKNYISLTRHFDNKYTMRKKVKPYSEGLILNHERSDQKIEK